jgi:hypothetical protein
MKVGHMDGMHCFIDGTSILVKIKSVALYNCQIVYFLRWLISRRRVSKLTSQSIRKWANWMLNYRLLVTWSDSQWSKSQVNLWCSWACALLVDQLFGRLVSLSVNWESCYWVSWPRSLSASRLIALLFRLVCLANFDLLISQCLRISCSIFA